MRIIFVEPKIEGNIGFLARVMENFDVKELYLVNPSFKITNEAKNRAVHANKVLENMRIVKSLEEAIQDIDFIIGTTGIKSGSKNITRRSISSKNLSKQISQAKGKIGVLLGREDNGLSNSELEFCDLIVRIKTSQKYPIMNVTHAAAIVLYEIYNAKPKELETVKIEKEQLGKTFKSLISKMNYPESKKEVVLKCTKHLIGRSFIFKEEAKTLIGFLKNIEQKLEEEK